MTQWEVVGGSDKGGILIRSGKELHTPPAECRLETGAIVKELELAGDRLHYELLEGRGPREGWASTSISGKVLLVRRSSQESAVESSEVSSPLIGNWLAHEWPPHCILRIAPSTTGVHGLCLETRLDVTLDISGTLQCDDVWNVAELKPRRGGTIITIRLRYVDEGDTLLLNVRWAGNDTWEEDTIAQRVELNPQALTALPWSPELTAAHEAAKACLMEGLGGDGSQEWPQLSCRRLLAWSDLHIDMGENMRHFETLERQEGTALIVSGDVCTALPRLEQALKLCTEKFDVVFYVPGNHELWADGPKASGDNQRRTSLQKFLEILKLCSACGVRTSPAFIAEGVAVCPLFSWYKADFSGTWVGHGGFDNTCFWPEVNSNDVHNPQRPEIADFFLSLNVGRVSAAASLKADGQLKTLWTFSHFLPRPDLHQGSGIAGCLGCIELDEQVREAGASGHLFGHSHQGTERFIEGTRYVQQPLGYPTDGHREERPLMLWVEGADTDLGHESILKSLPPAAAELAADRIRGALWGALCADALAMPVQWYYGGIFQIVRDYKSPIKGYMNPVEFYDPSFMLGSLTPAIGKVINHGKRPFWDPVDPSKSGSRGWHHHHMLRAGDNTLEGHMLRLYMREVAAAGGGVLDPARLREQYLKFMMKPGSHNDTFACVYHRVFFARLDEGIPPEDCPEGGEDIETIESLSTQVPVILAAARRAPEQAENEIYQAIRVTRQCTRVVSNYGRILSSAMRRVLAGEGLAQVAEAIAAEIWPGISSLATYMQGKKDPMASTYIVESFPSCLHYMFRYENSVKDLILANVNAGGENTHRGHILGALAGAAHGMKGIPDEWIQGLTKRAEIKKEIEAFVAAIC